MWPLAPLSALPLPLPLPILSPYSFVNFIIRHCASHNKDHHHRRTTAAAATATTAAVQVAARVCAGTLVCSPPSPSSFPASATGAAVHWLLLWLWHWHWLLCRSNSSLCPPSLGVSLLPVPACLVAVARLSADTAVHCLSLCECLSECSLLPLPHRLSLFLSFLFSLWLLFLLFPM